MTRTSILDYADAVRPRYLKASKAEKEIILTEFCETTGYHRKSAIRLLRHPPGPPRAPRGRPREYGPEVIPALEIAWRATGQVCSKRLAPFLPELIPVLEAKGELQLTDEVRALLLRVSPASIDRMLKRARREEVHRPYTSLSSSTALKARIPIRTFSDWSDARVGQVEADLVAHCGDSVEGFYLNSLVAVDVVTGWTECVAVWGKGQSRVGSATDQLRRQLPFPLLALDTDNGGEFVNQAIWDYCRRHSIQFTRSRPYKKNDQAYVEQKNWSVVRQRVGYDRFTSQAAFEQLQQLYALTRLLVNFFQPISKLTSRERNGAKVHRTYDRAQTPYQRLRASGVLDAERGQALESVYHSLNPVQLNREIDRALERLWRLADRNPSS